jgi:hypothetical protein
MKMATHPAQCKHVVDGGTKGDEDEDVWRELSKAHGGCVASRTQPKVEFGGFRHRRQRKRKGQPFYMRSQEATATFPLRLGAASP